VKFEGFVGPTYHTDYYAATVAGQRCINLYPEVDQSGSGKVRIFYRNTPGLGTFTTLPTAPVRGLFVAGGGDFQVLYAVGGSTLYSVVANGTATELGDVGDDASHSPAQIFPNGDGTAILIISAGNAYIDVGSGPAPAPIPADALIDVAYAGGQEETAETGCFLDQYWIVSKRDSRKFFFALNPGLVWDALDFSSKEGYPDHLRRVLADHQELWLFGDQTIEAWRNEGDADAPFRRDPAAVMDKGIAAKWSAVSLVDGPAWLGSDTRGGVVAYRARGFLPVRISTHAVEQIWKGYTVVTDAIGYTYDDAGHVFWVLTFPTENATWVYDVATEMWHERAWWTGTEFARHRGRCHVYAFGENLVGDHTSGKIYEMSTQTLNDDTVAIHRRRTAPHISDENKRTAHYEFVLEFATDEGYFEESTLCWSNDGGLTFNTPRTPDTVSSGTDRIRRLIWRRLGSARDRVYQLDMADSASLIIVGAYINPSPGLS
jgi:hypothetical protein